MVHHRWSTLQSKRGRCNAV